MASLSNTVNFLKSRDESPAVERSRAHTPLGRLEELVRSGRMIAFTDIPVAIGTDPDTTAVLVNQLIESGAATAVTRKDGDGYFLVGPSAASPLPTRS